MLCYNIRPYVRGTYRLVYAQEKKKKKEKKFKQVNETK